MLQQHVHPSVLITHAYGRDLFDPHSDKGLLISPGTTPIDTAVQPQHAAAAALAGLVVLLRINDRLFPISRPIHFNSTSCSMILAITKEYLASLHPFLATQFTIYYHFCYMSSNMLNSLGHVKDFAHIYRNPNAKQSLPDDISRFPEPNHRADCQTATVACGGLAFREPVRGATLQRQRDEPYRMIFPSSRHRPQTSAPNRRCQGWR